MDQMEEIKKELKIIKYLLLAVNTMVGLIFVFVFGLVLYVNYQAPKSDEQKESLSVIKNLKGADQPEIDESKLPDVEPEIYDDTDVNDGFDEAMGSEPGPDDSDAPNTGSKEVGNTP